LLDDEQLISTTSLSIKGGHMKQLMIGLYVMILFVVPCDAIAGHSDTPKHDIGTLHCKVLPHTGLNLLIHSSKDVRCKFMLKGSDIVEYYKGETGIKFGIDINLNKRESMLYAVLGRNFKAASHQLAGKYSGASGSVTFGLSAGGSAPIEKADKSISLQPIRSHTSGTGAAAGFSYLYLEADQ